MFSDSEKLVQSIIKENPPFLYGVNDTTPALAFLTQTPLVNDIVDTNTNIFRKGILNADKLTTDAIQKNALLVTHGANYPSYGIYEPVLDEIFNKEMVLKNCRLLLSHPVYAEGIGNRVNLFRCSKPLR
jgi:hypothetical protein